MTTVTKTFTDNSYDSASYKKTWTVNHNFTDVTASANTFSITSPTITAKFVGTAGGTYRWEQIDCFVKIGGTQAKVSSNWVNWWWQDPADINTGSNIAGTSNTLFTATKRTPSSSNVTTPTVSLTTSDYFNANNSTQKQLDVTATYSYTLSTGPSGKVSNISSTTSQYYSGGYLSYFKIGTVTLNAPPTFTSSALSKDTADYYAGLTNVSVTISNASAQYGGSISSSALTIGGQTVTGSGNGTLAMALGNAGTFTPTVSVTDSRGQTTTTSLAQITVNQYTVPSLAFNVIRTDSSGIPDDEGAYGVATATINYTDFIADLTQPTVSVTDENGTTVATTTTWYESWSSSTGVSSAVNWTNYNPGSPVTLYALLDGSFTPNDTYTITIVANDSNSGSSTPISQTLSTGFFTIDFQAGGKEIAFGAPANDNLTSYPDGLFKCQMDARFNEALHAQANNTFIDGTIDPTQTPTDYIVDRLQIIDANGDRVASFHAEQTTSTNKTGAGFNANRIVNGTDIINGMMFHIDSNGTRTVYLNYPQAFRDALGIVDYVVEEGTISTYTTYRKWASGKAECWYYRNVTGVTTSVWTTPIYYMDTSTFSNIWSGLFNTTPQAVYASSNSSQVINVCVYAFSKNGATSVRYLTCGAKSSMDAPTSFYAVGTWK